MPTLLRYVATLLLILALIPIGCGSEDSGSIEDDSALFESELQNTAQDTIRQMLKVAEAGQWQTLIEQYYGEMDKLSDPSQLTELADRFKQKYGPVLIPVLQQAAEITPVIEGKKALFHIDDETIYELHLGDDGQYGFHL